MLLRDLVYFVIERKRKGDGVRLNHCAGYS